MRLDSLVDERLQAALPVTHLPLALSIEEGDDEEDGDEDDDDDEEDDEDEEEEDEEELEV